jgi:Tfp pilus assembly protein PilO
MDPRVKNILPNIHYLFFVWALWNFMGLYEEYGVREGEILSEKESTIQEIAKHKADLQDVKKFTDNLEESKKRVENVFQTIDKVQRQLPSEVSDIEILDFFSKEKKNLNIPTLNTLALPEKNDSFFVIKPFELNGQSTFLQFLVMLERLSYSERIFNIKEFELSLPQEAQKGRFQLISFKAKIETYKYNTAHKEDSGIKSITGETQ